MEFLIDILKLKADEAIAAAMDGLDTPEPLYSAIRYGAMNGGKRIRPILAMLCARIGGGSENDAIPYAVAVELIHSYSLIHDDLPGMDNDDFRRGQPTVHKKFGEDVAILAGDALLNLAYETLAEEIKKCAPKAARAFAVIAECAGAKGMIKGQAMDISSFPSELTEINRFKTGALIKAAAVSGAIAGGASDGLIQSLEVYAENLGQAFQIADDIIDYKNGERSPVNYAAVYGLDAAEKALKEYSGKARQAGLPYGRHEELIGLVDRLEGRKK